ncbi:MAG: metal-dependent hydrolase [Bdellovibrionales bacterium]|nr:metal-dependent hydrolase [Bdellovibrionales bacterium]
MDNLTHSLIGVTLGRSMRSTSAARSRAAIWTAVIGNNFPDLDFLQSGLNGRFLSEGTMSYLLHHRGYSHTLVFAAIATPLIAWIGSFLGRDSKNWKSMVPLAFISLCLHMAADFLNNYGVHPFFPFNKNWFYGDTLFIVEPLLWFSLLPLAFLQLRNFIGRMIFLGAYAVVWGMIWLGPFFDLTFQLGLSAFGIFWLVWQYRSKTPMPAWVGLIGVISSFSAIHHKTHAKLTHEFENGIRSEASEKLVDLVLTVSPGNPACWNAWWVSVNAKKEMIARYGNWSWTPQFQAAATCHTQTTDSWAAPVRRPELEIKNGKLTEAQSRTDLAILGEYRGLLSEAEALAKKDCAFRQLLHFARIPFWDLNAQPPLAGDLRYDHGPKMSWAKVILGDPTQCLSNPPNWTPPNPLFVQMVDQ